MQFKFNAKIQTSETTSARFWEKSVRNVARRAQFRGNDCRSVNGEDVGSSCARLVTELCQTGHRQLDNYLPHIGTVLSRACVCNVVSLMLKAST